MKKKQNIQKQQGIFHQPLKSEDTALETKGCRHTNPTICKNNSLPEVCAFAREDGICLKPPLSWKKQFEKLKVSSQIDDTSLSKINNTE